MKNIKKPKNIFMYYCFKINRYFVILEWAGESLVVKDMVDDLLCANYRDPKTYPVY